MLQEEKDSFVRAGCAAISSKIRASPSFIVIDHVRRTSHLRSIGCRPVVIPPGISDGDDFGRYCKENYIAGAISSLTPRDVYYNRGVRVRLLNLKGFAGDLDDDLAIAPFYAQNVHDFKLHDLVEGDMASARAAKVYFEEMFEVDDITNMVVKPSIARAHLLKLGQARTLESRAVLAKEFPHLGLF